MKKIILRLCLFVVMFSISGCGTLDARLNQRDFQYPSVYPGVRQDLANMKAPNSDTSGSGTRVLAWLDIPFSTFADTFLLPIDGIFILFDR